MTLADKNNNIQAEEWADYNHDHDGELNWLWLLGGYADPTAATHASERVAASSRVFTGITNGFSVLAFKNRALSNIGHETRLLKSV